MTLDELDMLRLQCASATGSMMSAIEDGSVADLSDDEAYSLAFAASSFPDVAAPAIGITQDEAALVDPAVLKEQFLSEMYDERMTRMYNGTLAEQEAVPAEMKRRREEAMFTYSKVSPSDMGRIQFDRDNGDESAYLALQEKFYLS